MKLLGAGIDGRFNFRQHVAETKKAVECRNRVLRVIGGHRISGARGTLLRVHQALIQSRLFYAWGLISSATTAAKQPLEPAYLAGIRSASGAFRSSPRKAIYAESGQLPFKHTAALVALSKAVRLQAGGSVDSRHPLWKRASEEIREITGESVPEVAKKLRIGDRPWHGEKPKTDWEMTAYVRAGESTQKVTAAFGVVRAKYGDHRQIYTDGSKDDDFTGCGIVQGTERTAIRLPAQCSIFSAEAYAVKIALEDLPDEGNETTVIYTDSASVVEAVENGESHHPWIQAIESELTRTGVTLCWIPGHCGTIHRKLWYHPGNECTDETARSAKRLDPTNLPVPAQDILLWVKNLIRMAWEREWHGERDLFLRRVKPTTMPGTDRENQEEH